MGSVTVETKSSTSSARVLRVLLLEEDSSDAARDPTRIERCRVGNRAHHCREPVGVQNALGAGNFDAVISSWKLPDSDGLEALQFCARAAVIPPLCW